MDIRTQTLNEAIEALTECADNASGEHAERWQQAAETVRGLLDCPPSWTPSGLDLDSQRAALIEAMSGVSEERWSAGWMGGLEHRLHIEGGIWETLGRTIGWPTGDYNKWTWVTWDEAALQFAQERKAGRWV